MAAKYRKIDPRIWDDERFRVLSPGQKLCALYTITAQSNRCGIFVYSHGLAFEHLGIEKMDSYRIAIAKVFETLKWKYDDAARVLYIPTWWKYNPPENPKHLKGCLEDLHNVPATPLLTEFKDNTSYLPEWGIPVLKTEMADSYVKAMAYQEQKQEQEQKQKKSPTDSCTEPSKNGRQESREKPEDQSPILMTFPVKSKGKGKNAGRQEWPLTQAKLDEYQESFPDLDCISVIRRMRQWCIDSPVKRKSFDGMPRFVTAWLSRELDKPVRNQTGDWQNPDTSGAERQRARLERIV